MSLEIKKTAIKVVRRMDKAERARIRGAIEGLEDSPEGRGVEKIESAKSLYRLRVGHRRIIFSRNGDDVVILDVVSRGQAYDPRRLQQLDED